MKDSVNRTDTSSQWATMGDTVAMVLIYCRSEEKSALTVVHLARMVLHLVHTSLTARYKHI
eukprot:1186567-Prorocentrum_minimum.AAC.6